MSCACQADSCQLGRGRGAKGQVGLEQSPVCVTWARLTTVPTMTLATCVL